MMLHGNIFVLLLVIQITYASQWDEGHQNITVCYTPSSYTLFDWKYTSTEEFQSIRWQYKGPENERAITIMAVVKNEQSPGYIGENYTDKLSWDINNPAAMKFYHMQETDRLGIYSVQVTLADTGDLELGYVEEIADCADTSTKVSTQTGPSCTTMTQNAGRATDDRDSATTHVLGTSRKSITTADDNNTDNKLAVWQIVLSTAGGILFLIFVVVISIVCLHKTDKNHGKRRYNGHDQRHTHYHVNTNHPLDEQVRIPQQFTTAAHAPVSHTHVKQKQTVEHSAFGYPYQKTTDPDLLVAAGHQSVINISSKHDIRYPFSNITTRYIGYNTNHFGHNYNSMYEPKPDYDI